MQLKPHTQNKYKPRRIRESLALATCSLLAASPQICAAEAYQPPWEIDGSLLFYSEKDRVQATKSMLGLRKEIGDDEFLGFRLVADALTGASPNGAAPSDSPQTFTSPSGQKTYTSKANEIPLDDSFQDLRLAINAEWEKPLTDKLKGIFGLNYSTEHDYTSLGLSSTFNRDFNQRQTTLTFGASINFDSVEPQGSTPTGLATMPTTAFPGPPAPPGEDEEEGGGGETKNVAELLFGLTQVINRQTLTQLNYSVGISSGYLNDPYKILSVLESDGSGNLRTTDSPYVFENRPDNRTYQSIFWKGVHQFDNENVFNISYRYFWDDWDIASHTVDLRYRWELGAGHYLQPHFRYYHQNAASFYRQTLTDGEELTLDYASADYRLGDFTTQTIGLKYGVVFDSGAELNFRIEKMQQRGKTFSSDAIGKLQNVNLYPDLDATVIQASISLSTDALEKYLNRSLSIK